jgi:hypothetical protein
MGQRETKRRIYGRGIDHNAVSVRDANEELSLLVYRKSRRVCGGKAGGLVRANRNKG